MDWLIGSRDEEIATNWPQKTRYELPHLQIKLGQSVIFITQNSTTVRRQL